MAEVKTNTKPSRSASSRARGRQNRRSSQNAAAKRSSQARSRNARSTSARSTTRTRRSNASPSRDRHRRPESLIAKATDKAKVPAIAAGAALAGVAGGVVLGRNGKSRGMSLPSLGSRESMVKLLGTSAKEIGKAGYKIGQLTSEVRKVREALSEGSKD
jgi:hypothetical protein